jgi:hypothetical protein
LTGLANRDLFTARLATALTARSGRPATADVGVLYLDLDGFKQINGLPEPKGSAITDTIPAHHCTTEPTWTLEDEIARCEAIIPGLCPAWCNEPAGHAYQVV